MALSTLSNDHLHHVQNNEYPPHYEGVKALIDSGIHNIPDIYIRPPEQRPLPVNSKEDEELPVIDLADLQSAGRAAVVEAIGQACQRWGFFLVKNHGVPERSMAGMMRVARDFFHLPSQEKMRYFSTDPKSLIRYATSFNVTKDKVLNWRDFLRYVCQPVTLFPDNPKNFREANAEYCGEIRKLGDKLLAAISESLGLGRQYINNVFGEQSQIVACNLYPRCPNPELTLGLGAHSDPGGITILMQADGVGGLQVRRGERWVDVKPQPSAFIINLGDMMQILTNGKYRSAEHRVVVNNKEERISVSTAYGPSMHAFIAPAPQLIHDSCPPIYRGCVYGEFMDKLQSNALHNKSVLDTLLLVPALRNCPFWGAMDSPIGRLIDRSI